MEERCLLTLVSLFVHSFVRFLTIALHAPHLTLAFLFSWFYLVSFFSINVNSFNYGAKCRDDEFDLDLEDIMVMEAIWLSIQVLVIVCLI